MFLVLGIVMMIAIGIFIIAYFKAPHLEMMHSFKTTKSFVVTQIVLFLVGGYFFAAHFNGMHEAEWRTSWTYPLTIESESVIYAGEKTTVGLVMNARPVAGHPFRTDIVTWKPYTIVQVEVTRKWGGQEPFQRELKKYTNENVPFTYPVSLNFPEEGIWKLAVTADGKKLHDIIIKVK